MQLYTNSVQDRFGNALKGAQITVRTAAGVLAVLYADNGVTLATNPLTADATGEFRFYAANGRYTFTVTASGMQAEIVSAFEMQDALELQAAVTVGAAQVAADRIVTGQDKAATAADRLATAADRVITTQDKGATAADRAQTALDRAQTGADRTAASGSAGNSASSASASLTSANNSAASATTAGTNAAASANAQIAPSLAAAAASAAAASATRTAIDNRYRGALAADPATRTDGSANVVGDEYYDATANLLKRWNGTAPWKASDISTANLAAAGGVLLVGNAADKRDLADKTDVAKGGALLGHGAALNYAAGTIGAIINDIAINVKMFPWLAKGDGVTDDTAAINAALAASSYVIFPRPAVAYKMTAKLITNGHRLEGLGRPCENYGTATTACAIIEFVGVVGDCILNTDTKSEYKNIWFRAKSWATACNGLYLERQVIAEGCMFTHFNGHGAYFSSTGGVTAPYHSVFTDCQFLFNAKHGAAVLNGANAMSFIHCQGRWNGSPSYGTQSTVAGLYDGLYINGAEAGFPASGSAFEPQGLLVAGGDWSYNSRYGQNWVRAFDSVQQGGYIEGNLVADMRIGAIYGCVIDNPLTQQAPVLALVEQDPTTATINLGNYPNQIRIRGANYGTGIKQAASSKTGYRVPMPTHYTVGSGAELRINPTVAGGVKVEAGAATAWTYDNTVRMSAPSWTLGGQDTASPGNNEIRSSLGNAEGNLIFYIVTGGGYGAFEVANGGGANAAAAFFKAPKNATTLRSINAGGTVNASGADYAEYERNNGLKIAKGQVVGFKADGTLTLTFSEAVRFGIKSTNPSYVGGDVWAEHLGEPPMPTTDDAPPETQAQYAAARSLFDAALEAARQSVDRIAYSGKVPVNVTEATPGGYILAVTAANGSIAGEFVQEPTFAQYRNAVGRVNRLLEDGRCEVAVMVH